jgi:hypothetical protein
VTDLQKAHDAIERGMAALEAEGADPRLLGGVDTRIVLQVLHAKGSR